MSNKKLKKEKPHTQFCGCPICLNWNKPKNLSERIYIGKNQSKKYRIDGGWYIKEEVFDKLLQSVFATIETLGNYIKKEKVKLIQDLEKMCDFESYAGNIWDFRNEINTRIIIITPPVQ